MKLITAFAPASRTLIMGRQLLVLLVSAAAIVLSPSLPALAEDASSFGAAPARIANVYSWRHHQPTQQDIDAATPATPVSRSWQQFDLVQKEVRALLKQTDELDRQPR